MITNKTFQSLQHRKLGDLCTISFSHILYLFDIMFKTCQVTLGINE